MPLSMAQVSLVNTDNLQPLNNVPNTEIPGDTLQR